MTEAEWLTSDDPGRMLEWRQGSSPLVPECPAPPINDRKLRLFACAIDPIWESWANLDGLEEINWLVTVQACLAENPSTRFALLLREIVGNPFRSYHDRQCPKCGMWISFGEACPRCYPSGKSRAVIAIAQAIYADRRFGDLPILADALEEAGCPPDEPCPFCDGKGAERYCDAAGDMDDRECEHCGGVFGKHAGTGRVPNPLLAHLRGPNIHVRGCHVLDLILGKS